MYRQLDTKMVHKTIGRLEQRIGERFPDSGLRSVANELLDVSRETANRVVQIRRPIISIRIVVVALLLTLVGVVGLVPWKVGHWGSVETTVDFIQVLEPSLGALFFLSALVVFLASLERRVKRSRALQALHELRAMAHIVDMHQLTKDPEVFLDAAATASSPVRTMTGFELSRYLDYCSEMLSLISKVAALYVQGFSDEVAVTAVDEIESLTTGLSRKIWQKIMILEQIREALGLDAPAEAAIPGDAAGPTSPGVPAAGH